MPDAPESTPINSWIDSLSYGSFLNALVYAFHAGRSQGDGGAPAENRGTTKAQRNARRNRRLRIDVDGGRDEWESLQEMAQHPPHMMFRIRMTSKSGSRSNGRPAGSSSNNQPSSLAGERSSARLPDHLISILNEASVHRNMDGILDVYDDQDGETENCGAAEDINGSRGVQSTSTRTSGTNTAIKHSKAVETGPLSAGSLPRELASILELAGVQRSLNEIEKDYQAAREDSDEENMEQCLLNTITATNEAGRASGVVSSAGECWSEGLEMHQLLDLNESDADSKVIKWATLFPAVVDAGWWLRLIPELECTDTLDGQSNYGTGPNSTPSDDIREEELKLELLDILRLASRGKFLSTPINAVIGTISWFDPHEWFSLASYLVSRLEIGLWTAYRRHLVGAKVPSNLPTVIQKMDSLDSGGRMRIWRDACGTALKQEFSEMDSAWIRQEPQSRFDMLQESLVNQSSSMQASMIGSTTDISIPLLQWSTHQSHLKRLVYNHLEESYSREAQRALLLEIDGAEDRRGSKNKRKKKKRKQRNSTNEGKAAARDKQGAIDEQILDHSDVACITIQDDEHDSSNAEDNDFQVEAIVHANQTTSAVIILPSIQLVHNDNDAKILALKTIDGIIDMVFERVDGGAAAGENIDDSVRVSTLNIEQTASTAVVSNKASVDAAMEFLKRRDNGQAYSQAHNIEHVQLPPLAFSDTNDSLFPQLSKDELSIFDGAPLCMSGALDAYNGVACPHREQDIIHNLLEPGQQTKEPNSTAASVATSEADLGLDIAACDELEPLDGSNKAVHFERLNLNESAHMSSPVSPPMSERSTETPPPPPTPPPQLSPILVSLADLGKMRKEATPIEPLHETSSVEFKKNKESSPPRSPFKQSSVISLTDAAPLTRNFSRDDLRSIDERRRPHRRDRDHHSMGKPQLERVNRNVDALLTYRNVVAQSVNRKHPHDGKQKAREEVHPLAARNIKMATSRPNAWAQPDFSNPRSSITSAPSFKEPIINKILHLDVEYARSECALDGVEDASHCNVIPRAHTDETMTKDGATTISSVRSIRSPPVEEQFATVKEERDSYRDHCLMLGAENAKLRNLLASKTCAPLFQSPSPFPEQMNPYFYASPSYQFHFGHDYRGGGSVHPAAAMSDAGIHRGEHESSVRSEDGTDMHPSVIGMSVTQNSVSWQAVGDSVHSVGRRTSAGGTYAESDTSLEQNAGHESHAFSSFRHVNHQDSFFGPMPIYGIRSRLSQDIDQFMQALKTQLKRNESRRMMVVDQITKAVNAVWPRAQIKMYGSHMTRLCLPSSDMDFVICLPAVHKNAPAQAPGDLEGRNAINETNQKVLARKLKCESWLDQRSLKVIERTAVPVIKVSTKDSRSRVVQLDLSFDAKEHHGLEALNMIRHTLEDLPVIRPLVLVLKQFLLDRGLLTAYTGGLSSYCLFLMVTRYCQEQSPSWCDCGSLLMGLLDFYGNFFDPRTTGISVAKRQYFSRSQVIQPTQPFSTQFFSEDQWSVSSQQQFTELTRRNSFSDRSFGSGGKAGVPSPRFQMLNRQFSHQGSFHAHAPQSQVHSPHPPKTYSSGKPYTFDPIWVEDPLNPSNNVGRNAFRIFQVQRAFSDAHRALVAALEWDINSAHEFGDDGEYPLLKCLLQNEDVFFDIMRES